MAAETVLTDEDLMELDFTRHELARVQIVRDELDRRHEEIVAAISSHGAAGD
jgi:hypothetical protein